jgi:hypothetical protein
VRVGQTIGFCRLSGCRALPSHDRPQKAMACPTRGTKTRARSTGKALGVAELTEAIPLFRERMSVGVSLV